MTSSHSFICCPPTRAVLTHCATWARCYGEYPTAGPCPGGKVPTWPLGSALTHTPHGAPEDAAKAPSRVPSRMEMHVVWLELQPCWQQHLHQHSLTHCQCPAMPGSQEHGSDLVCFNHSLLQSSAAQLLDGQFTEYQSSASVLDCCGLRAAILAINLFLVALFTSANLSSAVSPIRYLLFSQKKKIAWVH